MSFVAIPDDEFNLHMQQIMALSPKQRKKWKAYNSWNGIKTRLKYENEMITDYMHSAQKRVPVVPASFLLDKKLGVGSLRGELMKEALHSPDMMRDVEEYMANLWATGNHKRNTTLKTKKKTHLTYKKKI